MEKLFVAEDFAGVRVHTENEEIMTILGGGGQPDLAAQDGGRGPTAIGNGGFPLDVFRFAPMQRQAGRPGVARRRDMPVAPRAPEAGPVRSGRRPGGGGEGQAQARQENVLFDKAAQAAADEMRVCLTGTSRKPAWRAAHVKARAKRHGTAPRRSRNS